MKLFIPLVCLFLVTAVSEANAQGIFEATGGPIDPVVVLLNLYTNFPHFSAKAVITLDEEGTTNTAPMTAHYEVADGQISSDFDTTQLAPESAGLFKQLGLDEVRSVFSVHTNEALVVYPNKKGYYKLTLPRDAPHITATQVRKETVAPDTADESGRQHYRFSVTADDGKTLVVDAWEARNLNGFPVKLKYSTDYSYVLRRQQATVSIKFDDIEFKMPEHTNFFRPDGCKQYEDRNALMAAPAQK